MATAPASESDSAELTFVKQVRSNVQDYWAEEFEAAGEPYEPAGLVLFDAPTSTGCGVGSPETGPFYCPADKKIYIDLGFYQQLEHQLGFDGDFALGLRDRPRDGPPRPEPARHQRRGAGQARDEQVGPTGYSVKMELQADCLAGVWASTLQAEGGLEDGDFDEAIDAAEAVGDDRIQETTQDRIEPESFTHGSSEQRKHWFARGFDSGDSDVLRHLRDRRPRLTPYPVRLVAGPNRDLTQCQIDGDRLAGGAAGRRHAAADPVAEHDLRGAVGGVRRARPSWRRSPRLPTGRVLLRGGVRPHRHPAEQAPSRWAPSGGTRSPRSGGWPASPSDVRLLSHVYVPAVPAPARRWPRRSPPSTPSPAAG